VEIFTNTYPVVSVYKNILDTIPYEQKPLNEVLTQIHNCVQHNIIDPCRKLYTEGNTDAYSEKKKLLMCFTPSGRFEGGRKAEHFKNYSGFIILDIDKLPLDQLSAIKEKVIAMQLTFCCFLSPSGAGLKILVQVSSNEQQHTQTFSQLKTIYESVLKIEIDKSGKDINRLCFYSSDREIYVNEQALIFTPTFQPPIKLTTPQDFSSNEKNNGQQIFEKCVKLTENKEQYIEGSRNTFVHLLANNCNRQGIPETEATLLIKSSYNYDDAEVSASINSAYKNNPQEFGKFAFQQTVKTVQRSYAQKGVVTLDSLIARHDKEPPVPFIWGGIKKQSFGFIFGPSKSGKTTFCENLAMCLAAQLQSFFGQPISPENYTVLFISLEEYWQNRTERNKKQAQLLLENLGSDSWMQNYKVINEEVPRLINTDEDWEQIESMIRINKANIVFIDSLSRLYEGGIEDSGLAKKVSLKLRELSNKLQITLIVIHHTPKQIGKPITQDSLAGSRILGQEADFLIGIGKSNDGKRYYKEVSFRYKQEQSESVTLFEIDNNQWLIQGAELPESALLKDKDGRADDTNPEQIFEFIAEKTISPAGETYTSELQAEFIVSGIMSKQTLYNCLNRLEKDERIQKLGRGVYKTI
jgi:KaiC/GvpD/RAD55 family RecA-like ATPase